MLSTNSLNQQDNHSYYEIFSCFMKFWTTLYPVYIQDFGTGLFFIDWQRSPILSSEGEIAAEFTPQQDQAPQIQINSLKKSKTPKISRRKQLKKKESAKKNSESNITNQCFSLFIHGKILQKVIKKAILRLKKCQSQVPHIKQIFYRVIKAVMFRRGRKYINKSAFLKLYTPENLSTNYPEVCHQIEKSEEISLKELCFLFRVCFFNYMKGQSCTAILTSKKINYIARREHLERRNRIIKALAKNPQ